MKKDSKPKVIAVVGPTASGKSVLAVAIAQQYNGEIVSADSRQFYRGMTIGTAKITPDEMQEVTHHLIDILNPDEEFSLYEYQKKAFAVIDDIVQRGKLPIIVGGTGLYVASIIENYALSQAPVDYALRAELEALDDASLQAKLHEYTKEPLVDLANRRRVIRQLEYYMRDPGYEVGTDEPLYDVLILEPYYERSPLYRKINKRVKEMMQGGLLEEVEGLANRYGFDAHAMNAIGYREFKGIHDIPRAPDYKLKAVQEQIQQNSRRYAKRQITWFKRYGSTKKTVKGIDEASALIEQFLKNNATKG